MPWDMNMISFAWQKEKLLKSLEKNRASACVNLIVFLWFPKHK